MINNLLPHLKSRLVIVTCSIVALVFLGAACEKSSDLQAPHKPTLIPFEKPLNFPEPTYNFANNPLTQEGFELGRKLFYDGRLSKDGAISCGSCHLQANSFADAANKKVSVGVNAKTGTRNSTTIINVAWSTSFFWDGVVQNLDQQPLNPIQNPLEMDEHVPAILEKLKKDAVYKSMFAKAFGSAEITQDKMLKALAQFMLLCVSSNSKYDKVERSEGETFTADEQAGRTIFKQRCAACHSGDLFTDGVFHTNGLPPGPQQDSGRFNITKDTNDIFFFKTPSLRNIARSVPYMHDGRFTTLEQVLDHYITTGIEIKPSEKAKLIAFLNTLTDETFLTDPKLAKPE